MNSSNLSLEDFCEFISGNAWSSTGFNRNGQGLPIIRIQNVGETDHSDFIYWDNEYQAKFVVRKGDILLSLSGSFRAAQWDQEDALLNQRVVKIIPSEKINTRWFLHVLQSKLAQIEGMGRHALVNNVSIADLRKLKFIVPTLSEQCRIANILDKADAIRRKRRQAIKLINDFLRSVFLEMFGDPVTNPKGWKSFPLEELAEVVSGVTKGRKLDPSGLISVPYMRVANVQDGFIDLSEVKEIDVLPCDVAKYALKSGDVLLTEGGDPDKLGRGAVWYNQVEKCIHQNHIFRVRVKKTSETDPEFLSALIGSEYGKRFFLRAAKQTTGIATINSRQLKSFPVLCPPYQLQKKFDEIKQKVTRLSGSLSNAEKITGELFNSTSSFLLSRNEG